MKFGDYKDLLKECIDESGMQKSQFIAWFQSQISRGNVGDDANFALAVHAFSNWHIEKMPFYNVYPCVIEMARNFKCDKIKAGEILKPLHPVILCRLPIPNSLRVESILVYYEHYEEPHSTTRVLNVISYRDKDGTLRNITSDIGNNDEVEFSQWIDARGDIDENETCLFVNISKLSFFLLMLQSNKEIITPVVCESFKRIPFDLAVEKSIKKRGGQRVFNVGKGLDGVPHYRRPHPALYWTGKGRRDARVIFRNGCVVHREDIEKIPTGYLGPDEPEVS